MSSAIVEHLREILGFRIEAKPRDPRTHLAGTDPVRVHEGGFEEPALGLEPILYATLEAAFAQLEIRDDYIDRLRAALAEVNGNLVALRVATEGTYQ